MPDSRPTRDDTFPFLTLITGVRCRRDGCRAHCGKVPVKAPPDEVPGGSQPSLGPDDVVQPLAGHEHPAEHALDDVQVLHLARADGRQRLVEQAHPILRRARHHECLAEQGQRSEPEVPILDPPADLERSPKAPFPTFTVRLPRGAQELDPAVLRAVVARLLEELLRPGQPAAGHREISIDVDVLPRQEARHPGAAQRIALTLVCGKGPLVCLYRSRIVDLQVQRAGKTLEQLAALTLGKRRFEGMPRTPGVALLEGSAPFGDQRIPGVGGHGPIIAQAGAHDSRARGLAEPRGWESNPQST